MAGVDAPPFLFPQPRDGDPEDVAWALSTADALWKRGEYSDALSWIRRASGAAADAEEDLRAIELAKAVAELAELVAVSTPVPTAPVAPHPVDLDLEPAVERRSDTMPAPPAIADRTENEANGATSPARASVSPAQRPRAVSPPREPTGVVARTSAAPKGPPPARAPAMSRPPASTAQRPGQPPPRTSTAAAAPAPPSPIAIAAPPSTEGDSAPRVPMAPPSATDLDDSDEHTLVNADRVDLSAALAAAASAEPTHTMKVFAVPPPDLSKEAPATDPIPVAAPVDGVGAPLPIVDLDRTNPRATPPELVERSRLSADQSGAAPSSGDAPSSPSLRTSQTIAGMPSPMLDEAAASAVLEAAAARDATPADPPQVEAQAPAASDDSAAQFSAFSRSASVPPPPRPVSSPPNTGSPTAMESLSRSGARPAAAPVRPPIATPRPSMRPPAAPRPRSAVARALDPDRFEPLADVPEDALDAIAERGEIVALLPDERAEAPAIALVMAGELELHVPGTTQRISAVSAGRLRLLTPAAPARRRLEVAGGGKGARYVALDEEAVSILRNAAPWVVQELEASVDDLHVVSGAMQGLLSKKLDGVLLETVLGRATTMRLKPGAVVVREGEPVRALVVVGAGSLVSKNGGASDPDKSGSSLMQSLGSIEAGSIVFPRQLLDRSPAPYALRAGDEGAIVLVAMRSATEELLASVPLLVELLSDA